MDGNDISLGEMQQRLVRFHKLRRPAPSGAHEETHDNVHDLFPLARLAGGARAVSYAGADPGGGAAGAVSEAETLLIPMSGRWAVHWGSGAGSEGAEAGGGRREVILSRCDCLSVPAGLSHGFRNVGDDYAHMLVIRAPDIG